MRVSGFKVSSIHENGSLASKNVMYVLGAEGHAKESLLDAFGNGEIPITSEEWQDFIVQQYVEGDLTADDIKALSVYGNVFNESVRVGAVQKIKNFLNTQSPDNIDSRFKKSRIIQTATPPASKTTPPVRFAEPPTGTSPRNSLPITSHNGYAATYTPPPEIQRKEEGGITRNFYDYEGPSVPIPKSKPQLDEKQASNLRADGDSTQYSAIGLLPEGVQIILKDRIRGFEDASAALAAGTAPAEISRDSKKSSSRGANTERGPVAVPVPRPRPQLTPVKQGVLKGMPDDERLVLAAEFMARKGRKETDAAEAAMIERMEVQRQMAQDLADLKAGKPSTVWKEASYPKAVRDVLGEEAYQSFVDERLEAGLLSHATAGLHLMQNADLQRIADGTAEIKPPHEKLAELMTPKVLAAAAARATDILQMRRAKPSDAVLLSSDLAKRKAQFDASFDTGAAVDGDDMAAFLFYLETAQREIGTAEANIEPIPQSWAKQVAARFATPLAGGGTDTPDRRSREAEIKQQYAELQQSFGPRTDDVIAYSLGRFGGSQAVPSGDNRAG